MLLHIVIFGINSSRPPTDLTPCWISYDLLTVIKLKYEIWKQCNKKKVLSGPIKGDTEYENSSPKNEILKLPGSPNLTSHQRASIPCPWHSFILTPSSNLLQCHSAQVRCCSCIVSFFITVAGVSQHYESCHSWIHTNKTQAHTLTRICLAVIGHAHGQHKVIWQCDCKAGTVFCSALSTCWI